ncbi:hypothetical protein Godav_025463 [Gossypium davidsonii]|uniref:Uncharacterized protein n=2 Tax=Gossypium TaxID=3633 RepID=A0A7J8T821_GOSDV|nr:hypothetical protein [Gossypium davidsonii]MBA0655388.1 hypothetical protein [Gossypium klotzschianum]
MMPSLWLGMLNEIMLSLKPIVLKLLRQFWIRLVDNRIGTWL